MTPITENFRFRFDLKQSHGKKIQIMEFAMKRALSLTLIASAFALSACGVKGDLKTPPPMWGDKPAAEKPAEPEPSPDN